MGKKKRRKNKYSGVSKAAGAANISANHNAPVGEESSDEVSVSVVSVGVTASETVAVSENMTFSENIALSEGLANAEIMVNDETGFFDDDIPEEEPREIREVSVDDYPDSKKEPENNKGEAKTKRKSLIDEFLEAEERAEEAEKAKETAKAEKKQTETSIDGEEKRSLVDIFLDEDSDTEEMTSKEIADKEQKMEQFFDEFTGDIPVDEINATLELEKSDIVAENVIESELGSLADNVLVIEVDDAVNSEADNMLSETAQDEENGQDEIYAGMVQTSYQDASQQEAVYYENPDGQYVWPDMSEYSDVYSENSEDEKKKNREERKALKAAKKNKKRDTDGNVHTSVGLKVGIAAVAAASVIIAAVSGAGIALYDMGKTPAEVFNPAGNASKSVAQESGGLTFIDADSSDDSDDGLTFIDADSPDDTDDGLTFIDADSPDDTDDGLTFIDANDDTDVASAGADSENGDVNAKAAASALDSEDSEETTRIEVTSEMADIATVILAGTDQELSVATLSQAIISDPNVNYPLPFTVVDEDYFKDALFVGDSRLQGFGMWSGLPGTYYCATSFNISQYRTFKVVQTGNGKVPIFQALPYNAFTKIYIKVGLNEMGGSEEAFEATYAQLIAELRAMEPRAIVYIHAILPVTAHKSATSGTHNNQNIMARNESLKQFAIAQKAYYIDVSSVVTDETGCLKPESAADGVHMSSKYMEPWKQYLIEHAVVVQ